MRHPLLAAVLLALPLSALADGFSYTYADARYGFSDSDATTPQYDGAVLTGSYLLPEFYGLSTLYVQGGFSYGETDEFSDGSSSGKLSLIDADLRLGSFYTITHGLDAYGNAGLAFADTKGKGGFSGSDNDFSYVVGLGLRAQVIDNLQLAAGYEVTAIRNDTTGSFNLGLEYLITPNISVVAGAKYATNSDDYTVGARYNF